MKNLMLAILIAIIATTAAKANDQDTLWFRDTGSIIYDLDFTPDDESIIAWNSEIQFWNVQNGTKEFTIPTESSGDFDYNYRFLVFSQNKTPKLLNWVTKEVIEGFESESDNLGRIRTAKSKNEFISILNKNDSTLYFWDIDNKRKIDSFNIKNRFKIKDIYWERKIVDFDYLGNNDEYFYITIEDNNHSIQNLPLKERKINTSNLFFSRYEKEQIDSVHRSTFENSNPIYVYNYISVLNNRNKVIMNKSGGKLMFYDIDFNQILDELTFSNDSAIVNDIYTTKDDNIIAIASDRNTKIIDLTKKEVLQSYNFEIKHIALGNISNFIVAGGNEFISLRPKSWLKTDVNESYYRNETTISPNPTSNFVNIELNCSEPKVDYQINDVNGALVAQSTKANQSGSLQLDFSDYTSGVYFITINCKEPMTYKIIKE
jgi:type IX secretion system substrate protein